MPWRRICFRKFLSHNAYVSIAYLVNQYPLTSHSFIRREIVALEALGQPVARFSVRATEHLVVDPADRAEAGKTRVLLKSKGAILAALVGAAIFHPRRFCAAAKVAWRASQRNPHKQKEHLAYLAEACLLRKWLDKAQVTHLHAHFGTNSAMVAMLCRLLGGPRYSFTVHGPDEFDRAASLSLDEKARYAHAVITISDFSASQVYRWLRLESWDKVHVVHCAVDDTFLSEQPESGPPGRQFLNVGRLCEQKGQLLLVRAVARLRQAGLEMQLNLVGDGPMRPALEAEIARLNLQEHVRLLGWKSGPEVREEILRSRAMVSSSFAEGLPVVLMESLALCRPVVATRIAGVPELVEEGVCGWLATAGSVDSLAEAMSAALLATPETLRTMGRAGRQRVLENHSAMIEAEKLLRIIEPPPVAANMES